MVNHPSQELRFIAKIRPKGAYINLTDEAKVVIKPEINILEINNSSYHVVQLMMHRYCRVMRPSLQRLNLLRLNFRLGSHALCLMPQELREAIIISIHKKYCRAITEE